MHSRYVPSTLQSLGFTYRAHGAYVRYHRAAGSLDITVRHPDGTVPMSIGDATVVRIWDNDVNGTDRNGETIRTFSTFRDAVPYLRSLP